MVQPSFVFHLANVFPSCGMTQSWRNPVGFYSGLDKGDVCCFFCNVKK